MPNRRGISGGCVYCDGDDDEISKFIFIVSLLHRLFHCTALNCGVNLVGRYGKISWNLVERSLSLSFLIRWIYMYRRFQFNREFVVVKATYVAQICTQLKIRLKLTHTFQSQFKIPIFLYFF